MRTSAPRAWHVYRAGFGFALYLGVTTFTLQLIEVLDAGPLTLALMGTALEVSYTLAEIPTGVIADRFGRRRSIVLGLPVLGVGFWLTAVPSLPVVFAAAVLWGVGWTCLSGADVAWITDEVGEDDARPLYASGARAELLGSAAGIAGGAALGQLALWVPLVVGGTGFVALAVWLAARMPETAPVRTREDRPTMVEVVRRTRRSVRLRPWVGVALAVMVLAGLAGEGLDRLWQFHLVADDAGTRGAVLLVAAVFGTGLLAGAAATTAVERRLAGDDHTVPARWLAWANVGIGAAAAVVAFAPAPVALAAVAAANAARHACGPLVTAWVNRGADPATRATLNSLVGQAESVGEVAGGPLLGAVGALAGVTSALAVSSVGFVLAAATARWDRGSGALAALDERAVEPAVEPLP